MTNKMLMATVHGDGHVTYEYDPSLSSVDTLCALMDLRVATHGELRQRGREYQKEDRGHSRALPAPSRPHPLVVYIRRGLTAAAIVAALFCPPVLDLNGDGFVSSADLSLILKK